MASLPQGSTITAIKPQVRRKNRVSVFIDGEFAFGLDADVVEMFGLKVGQHINDQQIEKILSEEELKRACQRAFRFLAARPRSQKELQDRLARYGYPAIVIACVIAKCKSLNYIDDRQFAFQFARSRLAQKPLGPELLRMELYMRGIDEDLIDEVVTKVFQENSERDLAQKLAEKRLPRLRDLPEQKAKTRLVSYLKRRGFSWETVREVVDGCFG
jgi:regulatory protein